MRIVLIKPCCIGDVVMATPTLKALRRGYPDAHITWAVGGWSRWAVEHHDLLDAILDTGTRANPVKSVRGMFRFVRDLQRGHFDMAVSLVRSPLMSLAVWLSGIPQRVGLDSNGRGFGYTVRVPVDPQKARHEADIYLDTARALGLDTSDCWANVPVLPEAVESIRARRLPERYIVVNPTGGSNPGMEMHAKRWPPDRFAALIRALPHPALLLGGPHDKQIIDAVQRYLPQPVRAFTGELTFGEIAALASGALAYIGNDTGLTHLAAAAGTRTVMIFGPSDPVRYAPYTPDSIALWKPTALNVDGVVSGTPQDWDWERDGISADAVIERVLAFLSKYRLNDV